MWLMYMAVMERRIPVRTNGSEASNNRSNDNSNGKKKPIKKWMLPAAACMLLCFGTAIFTLTQGSHKLKCRSFQVDCGLSMICFRRRASN